MTELMLVEGISDVQLIGYYLQKVYGWKHEKSNRLGIDSFDEHEHVESLSKGENQLILCSVGGNGKFKHFAEAHRVNEMIDTMDISTVMVVTDRDEYTDSQIIRMVRDAMPNFAFEIGEWRDNAITDSFLQKKILNTYILVLPDDESGALEKVVINSLSDILEEKDLIQEVVNFVISLKEEIVPELKKQRRADKATVGAFFSVRNPQNAMRAFGNHISKIDWTKSEHLKKTFSPFEYLGEEKPIVID